MRNESLFEKATESVVDGDKELAIQLANEGLDAGIDPAEFIDKGFVPGIVKIGELFEDGIIFLPELILAADTIKGAVDILNEAMLAGGTQKKAAAKVVLATVEADLHDIGKGIVASLMVANGFDVIDLGRDVQSSKIIDKAVEIGADVIGTSALLTTTMVHQKELEEIILEKNLKGKVKTMVGGAPVTERWQIKIGADGFGETAADSVRLVNEFMSQKV